MTKFLPLIVFVAALTVLGLNFQEVRRNILYSLNLSGDPTTSCCNVADILRQEGKFDQNANIALFNGEPIDYPKNSLLAYQNQPAPDTQVLGTTNSNGEEKWIEVSLNEQKLIAWEGNKKTMEFPISSGKWAATPKGTFNIWYKTRNQSMIGGSKELGTYYNLPNVPHNMFFHQGYAIHGAYWHNNFGQPMSHGCVNSPLANVKELFEWTGPVVPTGSNVVKASADNPGTRVYVH